jgi:hypothetical protein
MNLLRWARIALVGLCFFSSCGEEGTAKITCINQATTDVTELTLSEESYETVLHPGETKTFLYEFFCGGSTRLSFGYKLGEREFYCGNDNTPDVRVADGDSKTIIIKDGGYIIE